MDSDIPIESKEKKGRLGYLHLAFVTGKEVVKERAHWRRSDMRDKIDTRTWPDPRASCVLAAGNRCCLHGLRERATVFRDRN